MQCRTLAERDTVLRIAPTTPSTLQLNITRLCNQTCAHCHVDASPGNRESMSADVIDACVEAVGRSPQIDTVDITGGAPELHPLFDSLVDRMVALRRRVLVRHNLTVTFDPHPVTGASMLHLPDFFAERGVELLCSLPGCSPEETDAQRGPGSHERSIEGLRALNARGYGVAGSGLVLNLVHN
ncbi:MAG: radical SAM protein, partial [Actinobacteria bacterium]